VKLLAPTADKARFEREARAVATLADPSIMQLYDYGEFQQRPFMILECLTGGTLDDRLGPHPLDDEVTLGIASDVAAALAHAHSRGVVHRDLKPSNVLFDSEGHAKLADFGLARQEAGGGTLTDAGTVLGTAAYISPEQAAGEPAGFASDIYSFGVVLYRMLTGRLPFESADPGELLRLHREAQPVPPAELRTDVSPLLASLAIDAMSKNRDRRPSDGTVLVDRLRGTSRAASTTAVSGSAPVTQIIPPSTQRRGRRPRHGAAIAIGLLLAVAGGTLAWELTGSADSSTTTSSPALVRGHVDRATTSQRPAPITSRVATAAAPTTSSLSAPTSRTTTPTTRGSATTTPATNRASTTAAQQTTTVATETTAPTTTDPATTAPATTTETTAPTSTDTTTAPTTTTGTTPTGP
jgi:serine/threonine-protein kinase